MDELSRDVEEVLLDENTLHKRVAELGQQLAEEYAEKDPVLICTLKGAVVFTADLLRHMPIKLTLDFMATSSYGTATETTGQVRILKDLDHPVEGRHVIIVEDIVDTGLTLAYLRELLLSRDPASVKTCALLDKKERRKVPLEADYVGFEIPDKFVVGYGLDYADQYRNLPFVGVLRPEIYR